MSIFFFFSYNKESSLELDPILDSLFFVILVVRVIFNVCARFSFEYIVDQKI